MKNILTLICLLFVEAALAQTTYQTSFPYKNNSLVTQMLSTADGGTTVVGYAPVDCEYYEQCKAYVYAYHFNNKGVLIWNKIYSPNISFSRVQAANTRDGGFILFGRLYDTIYKNYKGGLLIKCDKNGEVIWKKQVLSKNHPSLLPQLIREDDQGNLLLLSTVDAFDVGGTLQLIKLNGAGTVLWNTMFGLAFFGNYYTINAFLQNGNKYYFSGFSTCEECEPRLQTASIFVINTAGNFLNFKSIRTKDSTGYYINSSVSNLFVNNRLLYAYGYCDQYAYLFPLTDTTTIVSAPALQPGLFNLQYRLKKLKNIFPFQLGDYVYFDNNKSIKTAYDYTIKQYDSLNRICPDFVIPEIDTNTASERVFFIQPWNSVPVFTDSVYAQDKNVKVSSDNISYTSICIGESGINNNQNKVSLVTVSENKTPRIFPNPANQIINIDRINAGIVTVELFSCTGKREKLFTTHSGNISINISDLFTGVYFLKITEDDKRSYLLSFIKN